MKKISIFVMISCLAFAKAVTGQELSSDSLITAQELLDKAINFHDPNNNWPTFKGTFTILLESPKMQPRTSTITLDLPQQYFKLVETRDGNVSTQEIFEECCSIATNNTSAMETSLDDKNCERALLLRNYYTYLYGLPMKLRDAGTIINPIAIRKEFKGKQYLALRVTYEENVGSDIWEFYFNPKTYAMEVYRFYKGDDTTTGEYIILTDLIAVNDIKMPKNRAWYFNKDHSYLGTDKLIK